MSSPECLPRNGFPARTGAATRVRGGCAGDADPGRGRLRTVRRGHRGRASSGTSTDQETHDDRRREHPPPARRRLARHAVPAVHPGGRVRRVHAGPPDGAQRDDARRCTSASGTRSATSTPTRTSPDCSSPEPVTCSRRAATSAAATARDNWMNFGALSMDITPFETLRQSVKPVVSAVNGLCQGGGLQIAMCSDLAVVSDRATFRRARALPGHRRHLLQPDAGPRSIGPVRTRDLMFTGRVAVGAGSSGLGHGGAHGAPRRPDGHRQRAARAVLSHRTRGPFGGQVEPGQLHGALRPDRHEGEPTAEPRPSRASSRSRSGAPPSWVHPELRVDGRL